MLAKRRDKEKEDDDNIEIKDFLRISEITSIRREIFRGHEVIAFDFEPRKGFKPKTRGEDIVNKLAGTIWVDEAAQQVARLEARFTDSYKFAGGMLASIGASTAFSFDQDKIDGEVWLPSSMEGTYRCGCCCWRSLIEASSGVTLITKSTKSTASMI